MSQTWTEIAKTFGLPGALFAFLIYAGVRRWWVFGWQYEDKCQEVTEWKEIALSGTQVADAVTQYAVRTRHSRDAARARSVRRQVVAGKADAQHPRRTP